MNDTVLPSWLVQSSLLFDIFPSFPAPSATNRIQMKIFNAFTIAQAEIETIVALKILRSALKIKDSSANNYPVQPA